MTLLPEIEDALLDAVRRDHAHRHGRLWTVRAWLRTRPRVFLALAGAVVIAGTAAAAVSLSVERSGPLSGSVPAEQPRPTFFDSHRGLPIGSRLFRRSTSARSDGATSSRSPGAPLDHRASEATGAVAIPRSPRCADLRSRRSGRTRPPFRLHIARCRGGAHRRPADRPDANRPATSIRVQICGVRRSSRHALFAG